MKYLIVILLALSITSCKNIFWSNEYKAIDDKTHAIVAINSNSVFEVGDRIPYGVNIDAQAFYCPGSEETATITKILR